MPRNHLRPRAREALDLHLDHGSVPGAEVVGEPQLEGEAAVPGRQQTVLHFEDGFERAVIGQSDVLEEVLVDLVDEAAPTTRRSHNARHRLERVGDGRPPLGIAQRGISESDDEVDLTLAGLLAHEARDLSEHTEVLGEDVRCAEVVHPGVVLAAEALRRDDQGLDTAHASGLHRITCDLDAQRRPMLGLVHGAVHQHLRGEHLAGDLAVDALLQVVGERRDGGARQPEHEIHVERKAGLPELGSELVVLLDLDVRSLHGGERVGVVGLQRQQSLRQDPGLNHRRHDRGEVLHRVLGVVGDEDLR